MWPSSPLHLRWVTAVAASTASTKQPQIAKAGLQLTVTTPSSVAFCTAVAMAMAVASQFVSWATWPCQQPCGATACCVVKVPAVLLRLLTSCMLHCCCYSRPARSLPLQLKMSDQDLIYLSLAGRQLVAKPYSKRISHQQGLESCVAAAEVGVRRRC